MNDNFVYAIFDSDSGDIVGFRFYRTFDVAKAYMLAYWPNNSYVARVYVIQEVG